MLAALVALVAAYTFFAGLRWGMHRTVPEAFIRQVGFIGVAISELRLGTSGFTGDRVVSDILQEAVRQVRLVDGDQVRHRIPNDEAFNSAMARAAALPKASGLIYNIALEDPGLAWYYEMAFRVFGFKVKGFYYFYYVLFGLTVVCFWLRYGRRVDLLFLLLAAVSAHYVATAAAHRLGIEVYTVFNARFLPVLGLIPALHLALAVLEGGLRGWTAWLTAAVQAAVIVLVISARSSAAYQVGYLGVFSVAALALYVLRRPIASWPYLRYGLRLTPLILLLAVYFGLAVWNQTFAHVLNAENPSQRHRLWPAIYLGLAAHPQAAEKYGLEKFSDEFSAQVFLRRTAAGDPLASGWGSSRQRYERVLRDEFMTIFRKDPWFVISAYFMKIWLFLKTYFAKSLGATMALLNPLVLLVLAAGACISGPSVRRGCGEWFPGVLLLLVFTLAPGLIAYPDRIVIADAIMAFSLVLFLLAALAGLWLAVRAGRQVEVG